MARSPECVGYCEADVIAERAAAEPLRTATAIPDDTLDELFRAATDGGGAEVRPELRRVVEFLAGHHARSGFARAQALAEHRAAQPGRDVLGLRATRAAPRRSSRSASCRG